MRSTVGALTLRAFSAGVLVTLGACGGGGRYAMLVPDQTADSPPPPPMWLTVGGTVTGLHGSVALLSYYAADPAYVSVDGTFKIAEQFVSGRHYDVQVVVQPVNQHCVVHNGKGNVGTTNVTDVSVVCGKRPARARRFSGLDQAASFCC